MDWREIIQELTSHQLEQMLDQLEFVDLQCFARKGNSKTFDEPASNTYAHKFLRIGKAKMFCFSLCSYDSVTIELHSNSNFFSLSTSDFVIRKQLNLELKIIDCCFSFILNLDRHEAENENVSEDNETKLFMTFTSTFLPPKYYVVDGLYPGKHKYEVGMKAKKRNLQNCNSRSIKLLWDHEIG